MRFEQFWLLANVSFLATTSSAASVARNSACQPWSVDASSRSRVFVISDISNEPDDTMSFHRLLLHSDMYDIQGMTAVTSYWLNSSTYQSQISAVVDSYAQVFDNLQSHGHGQFPSPDYLYSIVRSGPPVYGMEAIYALQNGSAIANGTQLLISAADASSSRDPLYVQIWGGSNVLAQALWYVSQTRNTSAAETFYGKVRAYGISDQDNTGAWIRRNFPSVRYVNSVHGWNSYGLAAWSGISGEAYYKFDHGGPDSSLVSDAWIKQNIQIGPFGATYPDVIYIMEGDSPSLMYNMQNGLNVPEHPEWGSWGGRYFPVNYGEQHFSDIVDEVVGQNGEVFLSNHATIWRWRAAYQNEMAARMQWTLQPYRAGSNVTHPPIVVVNGSCGSVPLELNVKPNTTITLDATGTIDPDGRALNLTWFHYRDISATQWNVDAEVPLLNFTAVPGSDGKKVTVLMPAEELACRAAEALHSTGPEICQQYHAILQVTNAGNPPMTRYKRVVLKMQPANSTVPTVT